MISDPREICFSKKYKCVAKLRETRTLFFRNLKVGDIIEIKANPLKFRAIDGRPFVEITFHESYILTEEVSMQILSNGFSAFEWEEINM